MSKSWPPSKQDLLRLQRALLLVWKSAPRWTAVSTALIGVQAVLPLLGLYVFKLIIDTVTAASRGAGRSEALEDILGMIGLAAVIAVAAVVARAFSQLATEAQAFQVSDFTIDRLNAKSLEVDYGYYEDPRYYNTLHLAQQEASFRPLRMVTNLTGVVQSGITTVGILILLATVHLLLAGVTLVAVLPALVVRVRHARRLHRWQKETTATQRQSSYIGWLIIASGHAKEVRSFNLGGVLRERHRSLRLQLRSERLRLARARTIADAFTQVGASLVIFSSYAFIGYQTIQGVLTVGDLVMYFGAVQRGQSLIQSLFAGLAGLYEDNLYLANVDEFLDLKPEITAPAQPRAVPRPIRQGIRCDGVSFHYPSSDRPILQNIDLEVRPGEVVALVGPNGSGKSTLVKLLSRLYDPSAGCIRLDGIDIRDFDPAAFRRDVAVVYQDYAHYHLSARDNIWFGDVSGPASLDRIREAARLAGVAAALERLPSGYDNILGKLFSHGEELSIGEWQKVALARAFMSPAEILIVDEPTSSLDASAEAEIIDALRALTKNRATIVISHRLSTVRLADRIYYLECGRILESGKHDELLRQHGAYARLFGEQAERYGHGAEPTSLK